MKTGQALILGICLVLAAIIFGAFFYWARATDDAVNVVGAATKRFESDIIKWRMTISRTTGLNDVNQGYTLIQGDIQYIRGLLAGKGIEESEISVQAINTYQSFGREGQVTGYNIQQSIYVISSKVAVIEELALNPSALFDKGIVVQNSSLDYFYSKLSDIKMELLAEATKDAQKRAEEIVKNTGKGLGGVTSLRAGVFQITEPFSTEVSDYGMYNTQTKQKDITVTVRAGFKIK